MQGRVRNSSIAAFYADLRFFGVERPELDPDVVPDDEVAPGSSSMDGISSMTACDASVSFHVSEMLIASCLEILKPPTTSLNVRVLTTFLCEDARGRSREMW